MNTLNPTITDLEHDVQNGLEALRSAPLNTEIQKALSLLVPSGYRPVVQLQEDRRKKRSTAAGSNWSPETGEIFIYFERITAKPTAKHTPLPAYDAVIEVNDERIKQCCDALGDIEKTGRQFIALKWFRDTVLANAGFDWSDSLELRQNVLTTAIEQDRIQTKKIPNPKSALHPTTVVSLKRTAISPSRFQPIPLSSAVSASQTLIQDRG
jgi:hypothetical protein